MQPSSFHQTPASNNIKIHRPGDFAKEGFRVRLGGRINRPYPVVRSRWALNFVPKHETHIPLAGETVLLPRSLDTDFLAYVTKHRDTTRPLSDESTQIAILQISEMGAENIFALHYEELASWRWGGEILLVQSGLKKKT